MATPQPIALTGLWTIAAGVFNLEANLPAAAYPYQIAWAIDRSPNAGYMVSDGAAWTSNAGPAGTNGNTILSGTGAPAVGLGTDGDFYVDVVASRMYGPKTAGMWGTGTPLIGPQGATGPAGLGTITPAVSARSLNVAFQPSASKAVAVSYSVTTTVTNPLIAGSSTATVTLLSDASNPPTIERCRVAASSSVGVVVGLALTTSNTAPLGYMVPPGHYVKLVSSTSGTASTAIASQCEETLG